MNFLLPIAILYLGLFTQIKAYEDIPASILHPVFLEHGHVISKRQANQPIRITPFYDQDSMNFLTAEQKSYLQDIIMTNITQFFSELLSIKPLGRVVPIRSARACDGTPANVRFNDGTLALGCFGNCTSTTTTCGFSTIPEDHLSRCIECNPVTSSCNFAEGSVDGAGVSDSDYVLYVSAVNDLTKCPGILAFAGPCTLEYGLNRPVVGQVNFCPLAFTGQTDTDLLITLIKHEMIHALGFLSFLYAYYRNDDGTPRTPRVDDFDSVPTNSQGFPIPNENTVRSVNYTWETINGDVQKEVTLIVTPRVVQEARDHFGCQLLEGAELEGQGGSGSAGSHWDLRAFLNELMVSIVFSGNQPLSRITLALLEDSGWYKVNYELTGNFVGNNEGCNFVQKSCLGFYNLDTVKEENVFCFTENEQGCTVTRDNIGACWIIDQAESLDPVFQYFPQPNRGGQFFFVEYCPFHMNTYDCTNVSQAEFSPISNNGPNSRCFNHMGNLTVTIAGFDTSQPINAGCYEYSCNNTGVYVKVGDTSYHCSQRGEVLNVVQEIGAITYSVSLVCPACEAICWDRIELCSASGATTNATQTNAMTTPATQTNELTSGSTIAVTTPTDSGTVTKISFMLALLSALMAVLF
ncbi:hypothetical protein LOD99_3242 [Oopsacas minuta]|uniref:Leishmanolysin-like peptidase n=1 Tax=Oopsacas minuta TaxID=111878 RepID=A0AAV7JYK3_9METZ|nr:hypothetical protein LOD99_3242 [Oopsacas minuta]